MKDEKEYKKIVGNRLREFAEDNYKLIKDFAAALNVHPSTLQSSYFKGRSLPGGDMLRRLRLLGCDINWLLSSESNLLVKEKEPGYKRPEEINYKEEYINSLEKRIEELTKHIEDLRLIIKKQNGG